MSNVANEGRLDYSKFDNIDSDVLEAYLQADFNAPEAEQMDPDAIFYILNLLEERQKNAQTELSDDTSVALERFYSDYYPTLEDEQRFLEFYNEFGKNINKPATNNTKYQPRKRVGRVFGVVSALVLFFCVGSVVCYACGINPFVAIARWSDSQFWFETENTSATNELIVTLRDYGIEEKLVPTWLPSGYKMDNIEMSSRDYQTIFNAIYTREIDNKTEELSINIVIKQDGDNTIYEIDNQGAVSYNVNDIDYYIADNLGKERIVWRNVNVECYVSGDFTEQEAKKMIDSIYKEEK